MARAKVSLSGVKSEIDAATRKLQAHAGAAGITPADTRKLRLKIRKLSALAVEVDVLCKGGLDMWPEPVPRKTKKQ